MTRANVELTSLAILRMLRGLPVEAVLLQKNLDAQVGVELKTRARSTSSRLRVILAVGSARRSRRERWSGQEFSCTVRVSGSCLFDVVLYYY